MAAFLTLALKCQCRGIETERLLTAFSVHGPRQIHKGGSIRQGEEDAQTFAGMDL